MQLGQLEEHPRPGLATAAALLAGMGTEPPVREGAAELLVGPGEAPVDLVQGDLAARDPRLVGDDEAHVEAPALARERGGHVRHEHGMAVLVHDGPIVLGAGESAAPIDEEGAAGAGHRATLARRGWSSPGRRANFTESTHERG